MKKATLIAMLALSINAFAQPSIQNGNNIPNVGLNAPVSLIVSSSTDITNGGANHTWDFSPYTFSPAGTLNVISPSSAPMGSSFPSANYAFTFGGTYSFFNVGASKMEVLAWTITSAGSGNDYTPNPRTTLKFPFNFNDTEADTWQKVGGSTNTVTLYYDSYGTLITPNGTYTDVVRIRENYGSGSDDYMWYILNPLTLVAIYDHNTTTLYHIAATQNPLSISNLYTTSNNKISVYPNPTKDQINFSVQTNVQLTNVTGQILAVRNNVNTLDLSVLPTGIYLLTLTDNNGQVTQRNKIVKE